MSEQLAHRLNELEEKLNLDFRDKELLKLALVHRSYLNEKSTAHQSNERLEFLGDSVLGAVVAEFLYRNYPSSSEGDLTDLRSALVRRETLSKWASAFELGLFLFLGKGEAATGGRTRPQILAASFEAVLGALFLDQGLEAVCTWLIPQVEAELKIILAEGRYRDYKSLLQETAQRLYRIGPVYKVVNESGPEHERIFNIEVSINEQVLAMGTGRTKQEAQQFAARDALEKLKVTNTTETLTETNS
jgi:ribonuclease-3